MKRIPSMPIRAAATALLLALGAGAAPALAQSGSIVGTVREEGGPPIAGVAITVLELDRTVTAGPDGAFRIDRVPAGTFRLEATHMGHRARRARVTVQPGATARVSFELPPAPIAVPGIDVSVVRPDLIPESALEEEAVRQANPRDPGELVRALPGVDAVRRGPVGLDPAVRGLRETEVGSYIDGARAFPAGPARMDSQLGHIDPSAIRSIEIVKGPYALTWGAGNLAAVRIETQRVPPLIDGAFHGVVSSGYDGNLNAAEASGSFFGRSGDVSYWAFGGWRQGDDYESGDGALIPADFRQAEGRAKIGLDLGRTGVLKLNGGYQRQDDIDYPGRLLNAEFFETANGSVELDLRPEESAIGSLSLLLYGYDVSHDMTNAGKPTAQPNPSRMPPFALDIGVRTESTTFGGRGAVTFAPAPAWDIELGGDFYTVNRDAVRTVERQDGGTLLFEDQIWPDVTISDAGLFGRVSRQVGAGVRLAGTARVDFVSADAGRATDFFRENVSSNLEQSETNLSGALTLAVDLGENWTVSSGLGSAVRTADALERYSDRFPASKAQIPAEFVGDPELDPER